MEAARRRRVRTGQRASAAAFKLRMRVRSDGSLQVSVLRRDRRGAYEAVARVPEAAFAWFEGTLLPSRPARTAPGETVVLDVDLDRRTGMRVALLLLAVRPLSDPLQVQALTERLWHGLGDQDVAYWFHHVRRGPRARVLEALRVFLGVG